MKNKATQQNESRTGTQSIERVVELLRVVASHGRRGMRIGEIVATAGLPESTCFRMLSRLEIEGLVERDKKTRKYFLGPLLHELGLLARPRYRLSELCDGALHRLAEATLDTLYLSERSGLEAVCTNRALGDYPIKALTLDIGVRRPLGVGAGGLAILSALPPAEAEAIIDANAHRYEKFSLTNADYMRAAVAQARENGYAFLDSVVTPGTAAIGVAFASETPVAAISLSAISARLEPGRREEIARRMQREIRKVASAIASGDVSAARTASDED